MIVAIKVGVTTALNLAACVAFIRIVKSEKPKVVKAFTAWFYASLAAVFGALILIAWSVGVPG
jgi:hypothetical protein